MFLLATVVLQVCTLIRENNCKFLKHGQWRIFRSVNFEKFLKKRLVEVKENGEKRKRNPVESSTVQHMIYGGLFDTLEICCDQSSTTSQSLHVWLKSYKSLLRFVQRFTLLYLGIRNKHKISESHVGERKINRVGHLWNT